MSGRSFVLTGGGVTIPVNTNTPDSDGVYWFGFDLEGWDAPDLRQKLQDRMGDHGLVVTLSKLGGRLMTVKKGLALALGDEQARWAAMDRLATFGNLVDTSTGVITMTEGSLVRQCAVQRGQGKPMMEPLPEGDVSGYGHAWPFRFEVPMLAPDPRRYSGPTINGPVSLSASIPNAGDFSSNAFEVTVTGGADGTTITNGAYSVILTTAYTAIPSPLVISFYNQTAVDGSGNNAFQVISGPSVFWSLAPGANAVTLSGSGSATIEWYDAWS